MRETFKDNNEQARLRDEWHRCVQGTKSVMDYTAELIYLSARIEPKKSANEIKEHFRTGLAPSIQLSMAKHPEWDELGLNDYVMRADRQDQIDRAKEQVRKRTGTNGHEQS